VCNYINSPSVTEHSVTLRVTHMVGVIVLDCLQSFALNFNEGNALKYIVRARHKGQHLDDLRKAIDYLQREIKHYESRIEDL